MKPQDEKIWSRYHLVLDFCENQQTFDVRWTRVLLHSVKADLQVGGKEHGMSIHNTILVTVS